MHTYEQRDDIIYVSPYGLYEESREVKLQRYLKNGSWYINEKVENEDRVTKDYELCETYIHPSIKEWENAKDILSRFKEANIIVKKVTRKMIFSDRECVEEKVLNYIEYNGERFAFVGNISDIKSVMDFLKMQKTFVEQKFWGIDRTAIILDSEAVANLFHQLMSFLKGDEPKIKLGERIFSEDISVYDNPKNSYLIGFHEFDDEGVKTKKKQLIADGIINDYLGTLTSKYGEAGNARGIIPRPDYFNIEVKPKDWGFREMIQDTKSGLLILGATRSEVVKNSIRIFPKRSLLIGNGEVSRGVMIREIAITLHDLLTIDAVSKEVRGSYVDDFHGAVTPFIRLYAKPILY